MARFYRSVFLCMMAAASVGCSAIVNYPVDRANDLIDIVGFDVYWGQGVVLHGQATKLAQLGVGSFDGDILKYHRCSFGVMEEIRSEAGLPLYYFSIYDRKPRVGNQLFLDQYRKTKGLGKVHYSLIDPHDRGFYEMGATVVLFAGVGFSLDVFQSLDFIMGWIGIDIARDDARNKNRPRVGNPRYESAAELPISQGFVPTDTGSDEA